MTVTLRLARHGQTKRPFYRIVAAEKESPRDGCFLEVIGTYNPMTEPHTLTLKEDRVKYWVGIGAQTSGLARDLINKQIPGLLEEREKRQREKIQAVRAKRKKRHPEPRKRREKTRKKAKPAKESAA